METNLKQLRTWKAATHSAWEAKIIEKVIRAVYSMVSRTYPIGMAVAWVAIARKKRRNLKVLEGLELVNNNLPCTSNCNIRVNYRLILLSEKEQSLHLETANPLGNLQTTKWECLRSHLSCRRASKHGVEPVAQQLDLKMAVTRWMRVWRCTISMKWWSHSKTKKPPLTAEE